MSSWSNVSLTRRVLNMAPQHHTGIWEHSGATGAVEHRDRDCLYSCKGESQWPWAGDVARYISSWRHPFGARGLPKLHGAEFPNLNYTADSEKGGLYVQDRQY